MREIKFRAWDARTGGDVWYESVNPPIVWKDGYDRPRPNIAFPTVPDGVILQQFTGLHDKNSKEIYEGDIIRITNPHIPEPFSAQVFWSGYHHGWVHDIDAYDEGRPSKQWFDDVEVIGNVYENPELI